MFGLIPYTANITRRNDRSFMSPFSDEFFRSFFGNAPSTGFRIDLRDEGDRFLMEAELPGIKKEDLKITVEKGVLTVSANNGGDTEEKRENYIYRERRFGSMQRSFSLEGIREEAITAEYADGVLKIVLPRIAEEQPAKREITIN